jgi:hypothetical protein
MIPDTAILIPSIDHTKNRITDLPQRELALNDFSQWSVEKFRSHAIDED